MRLRLLDETELAGDPSRSVEMTLDGVRVEDDRLAVRLTPVDLVHLALDAERVMAEIRAEAVRAEQAWRRALNQWHEEGRAAVEAREPGVALLTRVLAALRGDAAVTC
ncbi:hypothetical protein [Streptomyces sp. NPDC090021]|uniref:hypothetical protein n=1 Tax=Streptomyces sp. NPDC090021 TaxID=3365919 RepID=UPI003804FCDF